MDLPLDLTYKSHIENTVHDDALMIIFQHIPLKKILPVLKVNKRWNNVCLQQLRVRFSFNGDDFGGIEVYDSIELKTKYFHTCNSLLKKMPNIKSLRMDFMKVNQEDWDRLIDTISNNDRIEHIHLVRVDQQVLSKMSQKIRTMEIWNSSFGNHPQLFKGFPNLQELVLYDCQFKAEMFSSISGTLKKLILKQFFNQHRILKIINVLIAGNQSSSIQTLIVDDLDQEGFERICEKFENLETFSFEFTQRFNPSSIWKLKKLKKFRLGNNK